MAETVSVAVPAKVWWQLAERADAQGLTVAELLAKMATGHVVSASASGRPANGVTRQRVAELHALGHTDRAIASALGVVVHNVMYHRKQLGLRPNPGRAAA